MAINLNVDIYGAQFKAFVSFAAEQRNESFIACIEGQKPGQKMIGPNGEPRRIVASMEDRFEIVPMYTYESGFPLTDSMMSMYFLNGIGALRMQLYMTISAIVFIPLAWLVSFMTHDILWFMAVMCLCNLPGIVVNIIQFNKILKGTATGIWRK